MDEEKDDAIKEAFKALTTFRPERYPLKEVSEILNGWDMYDEGDNEAPLFTEAFLYNLFGKDDARTLLVQMQNLGKALGFSAAERYGLL